MYSTCIIGTKTVLNNVYTCIFMLLHCMSIDYLALIRSDYALAKTELHCLLRSLGTNSLFYLTVKLPGLKIVSLNILQRLLF